MVNVSDAFRQELDNDNRRYQLYADITLTDGTVINVTNENIWQSGWKYEESTSGSGTFEVGAFIIGKFTLTLNNFYEDYSQYDFLGATVIASIGLELPNETIEVIRKGTYTVTEATGYNASLLTLECLDFGTKFNKAYSESTLTYPATLWQIVADACNECGVELGMTEFRNSDFPIYDKPTDDTLTFGGVITAAAQIACCFVKMNPLGQLVFGWYQEGPILREDLLGRHNNVPFVTSDDNYIASLVRATDEDILNHNIYNNVHWLGNISRETIAADDVVFTGVKVAYTVGEYEYEDLFGTEGYVLKIENNPLITTNGYNVAMAIGEALIGLTFRPMELSILSDPTIEAGDRAVVINFRNNIYVTYINNLKFTAGNYEQVSCEAETPARNGTKNLSAEVQAYQQLRQSIQVTAANSSTQYNELSQRIDDITGGAYVLESDFESYASDIADQLDDIRSQIQGSIEQWTGAYAPTDSNAPASDWTTQALKEAHQGDIFIDTSTGYSYRWVYANSTWQWELIADTDISTAIATATSALNLASVKRRVFIAQPTPPYDQGDVWMQGPTGDILVCTYAEGRADGASYVASDWSKYNKYTDNTVANQALQLAQNHTHSQYALTSHTHTDITTYNNGSARGIGSGATANQRVSLFRGSDTAGRLVCVAQLGSSSYNNYFVSMSSSDVRLKRNIEDTDIDNALEVVGQMKLRQFDWKEDGRHQDIGFIADELEEIDPDLVVGGGTDGEGNMNVKSIETLPLIAYLTKAIQELTEQVNSLKAEIADLNAIIEQKGDADDGR